MVLLLGYPGVGTAAVLGTIEDLAPTTNSYVFTNVLEDDDDGAAHYEELRSLALRRGSLFVPVLLDCTWTSRSAASTTRIGEPG